MTADEFIAKQVIEEIKRARQNPKDVVQKLLKAMPAVSYSSGSCEISNNHLSIIGDGIVIRNKKSDVDLFFGKKNISHVPAVLDMDQLYNLNDIHPDDIDYYKTYLRGSTLGELYNKLLYKYYSSSRWAAIRDKVLCRDKYMCQACLNQTATQAHHLTYDHVFNEALFDLIAICRDCHEKISESEKFSRMIKKAMSHQRKYGF